jgi:hypothetical protein
MIVAPLLCGAILLGMVAEARTRIRPETTERYHTQAKSAIEEVPTMFGTWMSKPEDVPPEALKLLRNPDILSRRYVDMSQQNRWATVLIVHCRDTRDLNGHYPPKCYPNTGHELKEQIDHDWVINGLHIPGRVYIFNKIEPQKTTRTCVYNFLIVPVKGIVRDMADLAKVSEDYQQRFYGASQVQVVMPADFSEETREEIFKSLIGELTDCIRTLESGGTKQ